MGAHKYTITVEGDMPPSVLLGQLIGGAKVVALKAEDIPDRVGVAWLVERYGLSRSTIIARLEGHNKGSAGKHLYEAKFAMAILGGETATRRGRKRIN